jgi:hypothetical protein
MARLGSNCAHDTYGYSFKAGRFDEFALFTSG